MNSRSNTYFWATIFFLSVGCFAVVAGTSKEADRAAAVAQLEARKHSVFLDCHLDSTVNSKKKDWVTGWGSYTADTLSSKRFVVKIMNHEATTNDYELHWSFVGREDDARNDSVVERGSEELTIRPKESVEVVVESDTYTGRKAVYAALGEKSTDGIKIKGLVLQLTQSGVIVRTWYSAQQWKTRSWLMPFDLD
jgi:hypothetical protein